MLGVNADPIKLNMLLTTIHLLSIWTTKNKSKSSNVSLLYRKMHAQITEVKDSKSILKNALINRSKRSDKNTGSLLAVCDRDRLGVLYIQELKERNIMDRSSFSIDMWHKRRFIHACYHQHSSFNTQMCQSSMITVDSRYFLCQCLKLECYAVT